MDKFFAYDSPIMRILMFVGDLIILNLLFLVCCIPVVTIGAAQAGLHTALKVLLDKEDDSSPTAAFFRGFTSGFGTVTLAWGLMTLLVLVVAWLGIAAYRLGAPLFLIVLGIAVFCIFQALVPAFHARFGCTAMQLIRNAWFLLFAHPLRSIGTAALVWFPMFALADALMGFWKWFDLYSFMAYTPIWGTIYFSGAYCFINTFLKKPFKTLTDHYNKTHGIQPEGTEETEAEEEETPALPE